MIYDHRTYVCRPGSLKAHMALYQEHGFKPQSRHLGMPVLWATTEVGDVNSYVHIWAYKDLADRTVKRAALWADPEWLAYVKLSSELGALTHQENKILVAASFAMPKV
jgi:NIPSNAP